MATALTSKASQEVVPIREIREDTVVLKDGSLRMILMASALNFALKSSEEQQATILQYQNFLNSLDFSVQFFIQSRSLNIEPYIDVLRKNQEEQTNELLKIQMEEYMEFIKEFVTVTSIVNKTFYIIVPYTPSILQTRKNPLLSFIDKFFTKKSKAGATAQEKFKEYKRQLQQRADTISQGLSRTGVRTAPLNTEELVELFYSLYNPGEIEKHAPLQPTEK